MGFLSCLAPKQIKEGKFLSFSLAGGSYKYITVLIFRSDRPGQLIVKRRKRVGILPRSFGFDLPPNTYTIQIWGAERWWQRRKILQAFTMTVPMEIKRTIPDFKHTMPPPPPKKVKQPTSSNYIPPPVPPADPYNPFTMNSIMGSALDDYQPPHASYDNESGFGGFGGGDSGGGGASGSWDSDSGSGSSDSGSSDSGSVD